MKTFLAFFLIFLSSCHSKKNDSKIPTNELIGTWKMVYGDITEYDSVKIKDLSKTEFFKIINNSHFAFFNQVKDKNDGFYGGGGTYTLQGNQYIETLDFIASKGIRGQSFSFTIEFKGDTLIQHGLEEVKKLDIKRHILEKYIRIIKTPR